MRTLSPIAIALVVFVCVFGGAVIGMTLHITLPGHHLDGDSKDVVKLVMGLIGTMAALVLGLLIASAKGTYDTQSSDVAQLSADVGEIDRILALYGPETKEARGALRRSVNQGIELIWPKDSVKAANLDPAAGKGQSDAFYDSIQKLSPQTDAQRFAKSQVLQITTGIAHTRLLMQAQLGGSIPMPFLVVLVSWLVLLFVGFGLLTRFNGTVISALLVGALSVAGAIFLILELDQPYGGLLRISSAPLQGVLAKIGL
jgi:hypothetical protein